MCELSHGVYKAWAQIRSGNAVACDSEQRTWLIAGDVSWAKSNTILRVPISILDCNESVYVAVVSQELQGCLLVISLSVSLLCACFCQKSHAVVAGKLTASPLISIGRGPAHV